MNVAAPYQTEDGSKRLQFYCPGCKSHHFVKIQYLNDCFHGLKGQTINMVEV